ncbi:hypothetical protein BDW62DRAFT_197956 [Aspergillus aurantiobrunneus]
MEGILQPLPWVTETSYIRIPAVVSRLDRFTIEYSKSDNEFRWKESDSNAYKLFSTTNELAVFMQAALFFQVLTAFLESRIEPEHFICGGYVDLNTEQAQSYFIAWSRRVSHLSFKAQQQVRDVHWALLDFTLNNSELFDQEADSLGDCELYDRISLSVRLLISLLREMSDDRFTFVDSSWFSMQRPYALSDNLMTKGRGAMRGYLHRQFDRHRPFPPDMSYDYLLLNSLAALQRRPLVLENHHGCLRAQRCMAHRLAICEPVEYPFAHDGDHTEGSCTFVDIPMNDVIGIIDAGDIPLISLSREGDLDLQVVRSTPFNAYTAISHVWTDGMGNPQRSIHSTTAPHSFRLKSSFKLARWIAQHEKWDRIVDRHRIYFWIDTLCIPVAKPQAPERSRDLKFMAMKHITPIFATATNTLVLDSELQDISFPVPNQVCGDEVAARILSSNWMQRGWTLEEMSLSRDVVYQMSCKPYGMMTALNHSLPRATYRQLPIGKATVQTRRAVVTVVRRSLLEEKRLTAGPNVFLANRLQKLSQIPHFVSIWNSLLSRTTTKAEDGPLIAANLLDFNVAALKNVPYTRNA